MKEAGIKPDLHSYAQMLQVYGRNWQYDKAEELFETMIYVDHLEPDLIVCN